jgi:hypothetical protein
VSNDITDVQSEIEVFEDFVKRAFHESRRQRLQDFLKIDQGCCDIQETQKQVLRFLEFYKLECTVATTQCESSVKSVGIGMAELEREFSSGELINTFLDQEGLISNELQETPKADNMPQSIANTSAALDGSSTMAAPVSPNGGTDTLTAYNVSNRQAYIAPRPECEPISTDMVERSTSLKGETFLSNTAQTLNLCDRAAKTDPVVPIDKGKGRARDTETSRAPLRSDIDFSTPFDNFGQDPLIGRSEDDWLWFHQSTFEDGDAGNCITEMSQDYGYIYQQSPWWNYILTENS